MAAPPSGLPQDFASFSPFDDPAVRRQQRAIANLSYKTFNSVAAKLLEELVKMYPTDAIVRFLTNELKTMVADKGKTHLPALNYFKEIRNPAVRADGTACEYVDLLMEKDPQAFADPVPVLVLRTCGLSDKYKAMSPEVREALWEYVTRLTQLSVKAVLSSSDNVAEMNRLSRAVATAVSAGKTDFADIAKDPNVQATATQFVQSVDVSAPGFVLPTSRPAKKK